MVKCHGQKHLAKERVNFILHFHISLSAKGNQDWNSGQEAGADYGGLQLTGLVLVPVSPLSLLLPRVSVCSSGFPGTHYIDQTSLEFTGI